MKTHYRLSLIAAFSDDFSIVGDYRNNTNSSRSYRILLEILTGDYISENFHFATSSNLRLVLSTSLLNEGF